MLLNVNRAALLSRGLAAALLIQQMGVSASTNFLDESAPSVKTVQSVRKDGDWGARWRTLWPQIGASCFLIAACSCLILARSREHQRKKRDEQRIAASLSMAMRNGLLDEVEHSDIPVWYMWGEEDDADSAPKSLVLSRYRVLGYSGELRERAVGGENLPTRTIVRPDPREVVTDQELLFGIPRVVLKPEKMPFQWNAADTSSPSQEGTPEMDLDSESYLFPNDLPVSTGSLEVQ